MLSKIKLNLYKVLFAFNINEIDSIKEKSITMENIKNQLIDTVYSIKIDQYEENTFESN